MMPDNSGNTFRRDASRDASADDLSAAPPDEQALYHLLLDDGAFWRAQPELARIEAGLRERAARLTLLQGDQSEPVATLTPSYNASPRPTRGARRPDTLPPRPQPRRVSVWIGAAIALVVVGALVALLLPPTLSRRGPPTSGLGGPTQEHGRWVSLDRLTADSQFDANDLPAIAPSDPRVVYQTFARGIQQHLPGTLRRTDDGGATWHELPLPVPAASVGHAGFLVNPLDARNVFLTLTVTQAADCPPGTAQPLGEAPGSLCWVQFTSLDGGAHWQATKLPGAGWITPNLTNNSATSLQVARGTDGQPRLVALLNCPFAVTTCSRLIVSADSGQSWSYADTSLLALGAKNACATAADLKSATVYVVTTASVECAWNHQEPLTLWRSEDTGAHWTKLGPLATPNQRGMLVAPASSAHPTLLYAATPRTVKGGTDKTGGTYPTFSSDASDLRVSADGGVTWTSAPSAGIPSDLKPYYDIGPLNVLSDGSIVVECVASGTSDNQSAGVLFAWKPGDVAWRQLAPPLTEELGALTPIATTTPGADTLYVVLVNRGGFQGVIQPTPQIGATPPSGAGHTYSFLRYDP